jgi:hypothetical protein
LRSKILVIASLILLAATGYLVVSYGQQAYFVAFHEPFHMPFSDPPKKYVAVVLPKFQVQPAISAHSLTRGSNQHITVKVTPDKTVQGYMEVWIENSANKQVFRSPTEGNPTQFVAGKSERFTYDYTLPANAPSGTYHVSAIITSPNSQTDYYVNTNFATFTVS